MKSSLHDLLAHHAQPDDDHRTQVSSRIWVMAHGFPSLSAYNEGVERWRLLRLAEVADMLELNLSPEAFQSLVELHDNKGDLTVLVHPRIDAAGLIAIKAAAVKAWEQHNEYAVEIVQAHGRRMSLKDFGDAA